MKLRIKGRVTRHQWVTRISLTQKPTSMSNLFFNEECFFNSHAFANEVITERSRQVPNGNSSSKHDVYQDDLLGCSVWLTTDCTNDRVTGASRITPGSLRDIPSASQVLTLLVLDVDSCIPHDNCLGLYEVPDCGPESLWFPDRLAFPAAASVPNWADTQYSNTPCLHHPSPPDSMVHSSQLLLHHPSARDQTTLDRVMETLVPHSVHARELTARSPSERVNASRPPTQFVTPHPRYMPYALGPDITRRGDGLTPVYQCQWFDDGRQCHEVVSGTKSAIGRHLQSAHAIRLKGGKSTQVCLWEGCQKTMQGESIARHILTVHIQDKALCPSCELPFARADSMQRHYRTCLAKKEGGRVASATGRLH